MSTFYDEGRYTCEITEQAMIKASTGTPQFVLKFRVLRLADGGKVSHQYERSAYRAITEKTVEYLKRDLESLGFTGGSLKRLDPANTDHQSFAGVQWEFDCKHEAHYQTGQPQEKWGVAWNSSGGAIEGEPLDQASYRKLDALFGVNTPTRAPAQKAASTQEITDEDIPF